MSLIGGWDSWEDGKGKSNEDASYVEAKTEWEETEMRSKRLQN